MEKQIYITDYDNRRLNELLRVAREFNKEDEKYLTELESELKKGRIVKSEDMPNNVITMNSKVLLRDLDSKETVEYCLVFPEKSDPEKNMISILTPVGTALLGNRVDGVIEWPVPAGVVRFKVEKILYQPEASGDYHL